MPEQQRLLDKDAVGLLLFRQVVFQHALAQKEVHAAGDGLGLLKIVPGEKGAVVEAVEQIPADGELLQELGVCGLAHVGVTEVLFIPHRVVVHGLLQGGGDAHIVHHQAALLVPENAVDPGDGLHQVVPRHGLVDIHGGERRHVETGEPHIHHNGDFHGRIVVLKPPRQLLLVRLVADDPPPILRVGVALGHHHAHLLRPVRAQLQNPLINLHGDGAGIGHNHGLAGEQVGAVILVVVENIADQRIDGLIRAEDGLHLPQLFLALFNDGGVGILRHDVILGVNEPQGVLVQLEVDDTAFIVDRAGGAVLHRLGHVVDIDVVAEDLPGAAILGGNGRAGKADVCSSRQAVADDPRRADYGLDLQLALVVLPGDHLFREAVLSPVGFVCHDHNIPAGGERLGALFEFLHGGEDNAVGLAVGQKLYEVLAALRLLGRLPQEVLAAAELAIELIVQVVPVCDDHDGGALQRLLQIVGIEHHGQGLAAALGVPEDAALAVGDGGVTGGFDGLFHGEILVIARQNLKGVGAVHIEADEVAENVQKPPLFK